MPSSRSSVRQTPADDGLDVRGSLVRFGSSGVDEVEFLLAANTGSEPRPLAKGASGGELSRVMLALEVALAGTSPVPTFVFDEVDSGVGGKAAVEVGRRLAALGRLGPGAGRHPPAPGRGVRRPPRRGREGQRRVGHHLRTHGPGCRRARARAVADVRRAWRSPRPLWRMRASSSRPPARHRPDPRPTTRGRTTRRVLVLPDHGHTG